MSDFSKLSREFDAILASNRSSVVAMSIEDVKAFKALKSRILTDLLTKEVLSKHGLMCLDIPEFEDNPESDSRYFYIFDARMKNLTKNDLEKIVFSTEEVLGVYSKTNHINAKEDRKKLLTFAQKKFITINELNLNKVLTSVKLNNIRSVIRVSNHNREDISNELDSYERRQLRDRSNPYLMKKISVKKDVLARHDARKSLVDPKKYFNVDEREGYMVDSLGVLGKHYGKARILTEFKSYLRLLNTRSGGTVYDAKDLEKLIDSVFDTRYERQLEEDRKEHRRI